MLIFTCYKQFLATLFLSFLMMTAFGGTETYRLISSNDLSKAITAGWNNTSNSEVDKEMTLLLMNMNGQAILRKEWRVQSRKNQLVILPKNLNPGIYYLHVFNQQVKEARSLMVN